MVKVVQANMVVRVNSQAKEVMPDGHVEATRSHELYLNELAFICSTIIVP